MKATKGRAEIPPFMMYVFGVYYWEISGALLETGEIMADGAPRLQPW